jgi:Transposase, Mutator family
MSSVAETTGATRGTEGAEARVVSLPLVQVDEAQVREHLDGVVRRTVEETLNALLDAEADHLCGARRYERSAARRDTRAGHYTRALHTQAGEVELKVPELRTLPFETAIVERYRRRESSVEEALVEMYLAGVSVRRVEDITEALWGTRLSPSAVSALNQRIYAQINGWRERPIEGEYPYVYLDGIWLKRYYGSGAGGMTPSIRRGQPVARGSPRRSETINGRDAAEELRQVFAWQKEVNRGPDQ